MSTYSNDTVLFEAFQSGGSEPARIVFYRYFDQLCIYAERVTRDTEGTEDIVVDSFQKAWERRTSFPSLEDFRRYVYRSVYNGAIDRVRARQKHASAHADIKYLYEQDVEGTETMELEMLRAELLREIYLEVEALPDRCREIFQLIFIHGLSTEEIASRLNINVQTVRSQKARAIELLRSRLLRQGRLIVFFALLGLLNEQRKIFSEIF